MTTKRKKPVTKNTTPTETAKPEGISINLAAAIPQLQNPDPEVVKAATEALEKAVEIEPENPLALHGLGIARAQKQQYELAFELFERATLADPKFAPPFSNLGNLHRLAGRNEEALKTYRHALKLQPSLADAHYNISILLEQQGKPDEAEESLKRALLFRPTYSEAHNNLGNLLLKNGKTEQAISHFRQALVWNSELKQARANLIIALYRLGRCTDAQSEVEKALAQSPGDATILRTQAAGLAYQGLLEDARKVNLKILELEPNAPDVQLNMGELLLARDDYEGALACYRELLARKDVHPALCVSAMANVMLAQGNLTEAREMFQQGLLLEERLPTLTIGLGKTLLEAGDIALGIQTLKRATELMPNAAEIHSLLIHGLHLNPALSAAERDAEMSRWVERHSKKETIEKKPDQPTTNSRQEKSALPVGFLVGDVDAPLQAGCLEALFSYLDSTRIDLHVYHTGSRADDQTKRLKELVSHWRTVSSRSLTDLAEQIRDDGIEILIDTVGHNLGNRLAVFTTRVAPVQATWLGDFSTTGVPEMDYRLTDTVMTPETDAVATTERPIHLPVAACYSATPDLPAPSALPAKTAGTLTFGAPSRLGAINAAVLDVWAEILTLVPGSRLVIFSNVAVADEASRERIRKLFLLREIDAERVTILPRLDQDAYWEALASLDIVLDTFPFPLGLRALDSLWMGVPVLTLAGASPYQRATLSFVTQAGLPEWGASNKEEYVRKAVGFAADLDQLEKIRLGLRDKLIASPLLDGKLFAEFFTSALEAVRPEVRRPPKRGRKKPG